MTCRHHVSDPVLGPAAGRAVTRVGALRRRRQRRRRRILLQHLLELRIHRRGAAADGDLRQLMASREFVLERMLVGQVRGHLAGFTRGDLDDRIAHPQPGPRGQLARAAEELLALDERLGQVHRIDEDR